MEIIFKEMVETTTATKSHVTQFLWPQSKEMPRSRMCTFANFVYKD